MEQHFVVTNRYADRRFTVDRKSFSCVYNILTEGVFGLRESEFDELCVLGKIAIFGVICNYMPESLVKAVFIRESVCMAIPYED